MEVVFEEEREDRVQAGRETAPKNSGAQPSRGVPNSSVLRSLLMAAPKFTAAPDARRRQKFRAGPSKKRDEGTARFVPHAREKINLLSTTLLSRSTNASIHRLDRSNSITLPHTESYCDSWNLGIGRRL